MVKIDKALLSVSDKYGIVEFAKELAMFNIQFISTGGTAKLLRENGLDFLDVCDYTGCPEMLGGRVKTLHPKIHGGLLGVRSSPDHLREMAEFNIEKIDMIVVNAFPFEQAIHGADASHEDVMDKIDIGGMALARSAAKNFESVTVIVDSGDYNMVIEDLHNNNGAVSKETNLKLAAKVFETTSRYDYKIFEYLKQRTASRAECSIEIPR